MRPGPHGCRIDAGTLGLVTGLYADLTAGSGTPVL
jgi:hypothetical protein